VKTNIGNYAKMRIDSYGDNLVVTIVYQDDGTPLVPEFPSSIVLLASLIAITGVTVYARSSGNLRGKKRDRVLLAKCPQT